MRHFVRLFVKITGFIPTILYLKPKLYYEDKTCQNRRIKRGALVCSNHKGPLDMVLLILVFWSRSLHFLIGETLFNRNKILRWFLIMLGSIEVDRKNLDLSFVTRSVKEITNHAVVVSFPEGSFNQGNQIRPFKSSSILIAHQANRPIIPVYHRGNYGLFKRVKVVIGKPFWVRDHLSSFNPSKEELAMVSALLRQKIEDLSHLIPKQDA